jgi:(2Fe-2S) ferredoxin
VVYPEAIWYGNVMEADVDEIIDSHIVGGKPVERLILKDSCLNTAACEHRKSDGQRSIAISQKTDLKS